MRTQQDPPDTAAEAAAETDALRLSDLSGRDAGFDDGFDGDFDADDSGPGAGRVVVLAVVAAGVAAVAVIGLKIALDRRKSSRRYRRAVRGIEDARDALLSAAAELPERGRDVLQRVKPF